MQLASTHPRILAPPAAHARGRVHRRAAPPGPIVLTLPFTMRRSSGDWRAALPCTELLPPESTHGNAGTQQQIIASLYPTPWPAQAPRYRGGALHHILAHPTKSLSSTLAGPDA